MHHSNIPPEVILGIKCRKAAEAAGQGCSSTSPSACACVSQGGKGCRRY